MSFRNRIVEFSVLLKVTDGAKLIGAARQQCIADGDAVDNVDAEDAVMDDDYATAVHVLLRIGEPPAGTEIIDVTTCE